MARHFLFITIIIISLSLYLRADQTDFCNMYEPEEVLKALESGAVIDKNNDPILCFSGSNTNNAFEIVKILLEHGSNINAMTEMRHNVLYQALDNGENEHTHKMVTLLLSKGANPNAVSTTYSTALVIAVSKWGPDIVKLMLDKGAKANLKCSSGTYPVHHAKSKETLKLLLDSGADIKSKNREKWNILHYLATTSSSGTSDEYKNNVMETIKYAIEKGADINAQANYIPGGIHFVGVKEHFHLATPLLVAVINNNPEMVKLLLEEGANPNIKDSAKKIPADYAADLPEVLSLLKK